MFYTINSLSKHFIFSTFNQFLNCSQNIYKNKFKILFFYKNILNTNIKINYNALNLFNRIKKKKTLKNFVLFKKIIFLNKNTIFYKNIIKNKTFQKFIYIYINYSNKNYLNNSLQIGFVHYISNIFKKQFFVKNYFFYKNIFKNIFLLKNINQFIFNKNYVLLNNNLLNLLKINFFNFKKLNFIYNNQFPLIFFKKYNKHVFEKFNLKKKNNFVNLFNNYILNFLEFFFKKQFFLKISNKINLDNQKKILFFLNNFNNNVKFQKFVELNEIVELFCVVFIYKDLTLFKNWLIYTLNVINIKNHKKFFVLLGDFFTDNFSLFSILFGIKGFYFNVKGKIGLSGNAKKKFFFFKKGSLKVSSKYSKIDNQRFFIKTNCGSLGVNTILTY